MRHAEVAAINAIQAILDGLDSKQARLAVVRATAELESVNQCRVIEFGNKPNETIAR